MITFDYTTIMATLEPKGMVRTLGEMSCDIDAEERVITGRNTKKIPSGMKKQNSTT